MIDLELFKKMIFSVFHPLEGEKILILYDIPTKNICDNKKWKERRELAEEWYENLKIIGNEECYEVEITDFESTGDHNKALDEIVLKKWEGFSILIMMTEYSVTSSLVEFVKKHHKSVRCASMPRAEKRMMNTVFSMDYSHVKMYAHNLRKLLERSIVAELQFSTGDKLRLDLRNRHAGADDGDCTKHGSFINLPSGEGFIAPYEATGEENDIYGESKTGGVLPFIYKGEIVRAHVRNNRIDDFECNMVFKDELNSYFDGFSHRRNIAELGIGCNPYAKVTGNFIEDEKVGVHVAYGTSSHLGGKIRSDIHRDIVYARDSSIYADSLILYDSDNNSFSIVKNAEVQYDLLRNDKWQL